MSATPTASPASRWQPWRVWRHRVNPVSMKRDAMAGFTGALIVLPQGIAYAAIAGLPPEYGLYCAIGPAVVAALFGSSWHLVSGPTAAIAIVVFSSLAPLATPGSPQYIVLALTMGFLVGAIQLAIGLARLGNLARYISHSVVVGFTSGAAFLIAASQLKHFLHGLVELGGELLLPFFDLLAARILHGLCGSIHRGGGVLRRICFTWSGPLPGVPHFACRLPHLCFGLGGMLFRLLRARSRCVGPILLQTLS